MTELYAAVAALSALIENDRKTSQEIEWLAQSDEWQRVSRLLLSSPDGAMSDPEASDHNRVRPRRHFMVTLDLNYRGRRKALSVNDLEYR
jgi:hypothetical protein